MVREDEESKQSASNGTNSELSATNLTASEVMSMDGRVVYKVGPDGRYHRVLNLSPAEMERRRKAPIVFFALMFSMVGAQVGIFA